MLVNISGVNKEDHCSSTNQNMTSWTSDTLGFSCES